VLADRDAMLAVTTLESGTQRAFDICTGRRREVVLKMEVS